MELDWLTLIIVVTLAWWGGVNYGRNAEHEADMYWKLAENELDPIIKRQHLLNFAKRLPFGEYRRTWFKALKSTQGMPLPTTLIKK